jgi:cellulose synthase (UDP-forming)
LDYPDKSKVHISLRTTATVPRWRNLRNSSASGIFRSPTIRSESGNLNNALRQTHSPLVATFDADMIARREFLMETVPYFFLPRMQHKDGAWEIRKPEEIDPNYKIGFIQTPQSFYNPDLFQFNLYAEQNIPNEQDFFSRQINVMRNSTNAVSYTAAIRSSPDRRSKRSADFRRTHHRGL